MSIKLKENDKMKDQKHGDLALKIKVNAQSMLFSSLILVLPLLNEKEVYL